mgnify:CR=1 FL=1
MYEELYKRILDAWGVESQLNMVIEEVGELLQAISKLRRSHNKSDIEKDQAYCHLCEEIGDVQNMVNQLKYTFDKDLIEMYEKQKLVRIEAKVDKFEKKQPVCPKCNGNKELPDGDGIIECNNCEGRGYIK